jgi:hypothetical protein
MSAKLVEDRTASHGVADDMESALYVVLWTALMFSPSLMSEDERTIFISSTFNSLSLGNFGAQGKRNFLTSQKELIGGQLFPGRQALNALVQDLTNLFKYHYYVPDKVECEAYKTISTSTTPGSQELARLLSPHRVEQTKKDLENHNAIITIFNHHLASTLWQHNDGAVEQSLRRLEVPHNASSGRVIFTKSTHTLEIIEEEKNRKKRKLNVPVASTAAPAGS